MKADFEEKEFETQINAEMHARYGFIYAPGQVLENVIGIDAALVCTCSEFWKLFKPPYPTSLFPVEVTPSGLQLNPAYWSNLDQALDHFPPFKFNLFLQHKRPERLTDARSKQWVKWCQPYFRFDITPHQQVALEKLAAIAGDDALVAYSGPAFHSYSELWAHAVAAKIIANTNFVAASVLNGHQHYTYIDAGNGGYACSEPTEVEGLNFVEESGRRRDFRRLESNHDALFRLANYVLAAVEGTAMQMQLDALASVIPGEVPEIGRAILRSNAFAVLTNTSWMIG